MLNYITPFIVIAIAALFIVFQDRNFDYQCGYCGQIFSLSIINAIFLPHSMGKKLAVCPYCGERTWAAPVRKEK